MGIDALRHERSGFITQGACFAQSDLGVVAQRDALLLAEPVVAQMPRFAAGGGDYKAEAVSVRDAVAFLGGFGLPHGQIRECHH